MLNGLDRSFFFFFDLGGFSIPHESSETTLLQFVAVNASQQPPQLALQEPNDGSRGQAVKLGEKDKALAHTVAATSLWSVSQSSVLQNQPCLRPQDGVRPFGDLKDFVDIMADDAGLMLALLELSGLQSSLLLLYGGRLSFSYRCCRSQQQPQQCAGILAVSVLVFGVIAAT